MYVTAGFVTHALSGREKPLLETVLRDQEGKEEGGRK